MTTPVNPRLAEPSTSIDNPLLWEPSISFLKIGIVFILIGITAFEIFLFMFAPAQTGRALAGLVLVLIALAAWFMLSHGRIQATVAVLGLGTWGYVTVISIFFGGVNGTSIIIYPLTILLIGWLVSTQTAVVVAVLTTVVTLGLVAAELWGILPAAPPTPLMMRWVVQASVFLCTGVLITFIVRSYCNRLTEVRKLGDELAQRTAELQLIEANLNRAQAVANVGSWVYDLRADKITLSEEACRIFGLRKRKTGSFKSYRMCVHPEDRDAADCSWRGALKGGAAIDIEHRIVVGQSMRWVRQRAEFECDADGKPLRAIGTTQDITERTTLEAQLRESQKMEALGTLAGGIAHDFNNALAAVMGNLELARQDVGAGHPAQHSLDEIAKAGSRAKALVQQILAFGRRQVLERKRIVLAPVLEETMRLLRATQPAGIRVSHGCAPDTPRVMADGTQIAQVLVNLCTNAWHALEGQVRPGEVDIQLQAYDHTPGAAQMAHTTHRLGNLLPGRYACLTVRDNGAGMDQATQRRIFEPFFTTKGVGKGTGLGLAVVHGIVQAHEASIEVASIPNEGTTFRIYFPAAEVVSPDDDEPEQHAPRDGRGGDAFQTQGKGKQVLYVDDDEALVFVITSLLQRQGYRVSSYTDPHEALAAVRADPMKFDLVVTDYNMPGISGLALARELKNIRADLPVAMASGYFTDELRAHTLDAGVRELINKPNIVEELCDAVARLVR